MTTNALPLTETLSPADEAAVAAAVHSANLNRTPVYPIGGGTALHCGERPTRQGIGLSLCRLNRVLDYPADDMTITVEAGLTVAELQSRLAAKRQWAPVDVPRADRATIGGAVAANQCGPRQYAYGTLRDYVIGIRAVDGLGNVFSGGGRVVKNAAGYNMCRLLVGSLGTIGIITQVTLTVRPMPETSAWVTCEVPDSGMAERLLAGLVQSRTLPAAIELLAGQAACGFARLLVAFEGSTAEVDWMVNCLSDEWRAAGVSQITTIAGPDAGKQWHDLIERPADMQLRVLPSDTVATMVDILERDPGGSIQAHAGNGILRITSSPLLPAGDCCRADFKSAPQDIDARASISRAIKERFDPAGILNPGRLVFA